MAIKNNKLVMVLEDDTDLAEGIELSLQNLRMQNRKLFLSILR